jgi:hypothetical protein
MDRDDDRQLTHEPDETTDRCTCGNGWPCIRPVVGAIARQHFHGHRRHTAADIIAMDEQRLQRRAGWQ